MKEENLEIVPWKTVIIGGFQSIEELHLETGKQGIFVSHWARKFRSEKSDRVSDEEKSREPFVVIPTQPHTSLLGLVLVTIRNESIQYRTLCDHVTNIYGKELCPQETVFHVSRQYPACADDVTKRYSNQGLRFAMPIIIDELGDPLIFRFQNDDGVRSISVQMAKDNHRCDPGQTFVFAEPSKPTQE